MYVNFLFFCFILSFLFYVLYIRIIYFYSCNCFLWLQSVFSCFSLSAVMFIIIVWWRWWWTYTVETAIFGEIKTRCLSYILQMSLKYILTRMSFPTIHGIICWARFTHVLIWMICAFYAPYAIKCGIFCTSTLKIFLNQMQFVI